MTGLDLHQRAAGRRGPSWLNVTLRADDPIVSALALAAQHHAPAGDGRWLVAVTTPDGHITILARCASSDEALACARDEHRPADAAFAYVLHHAHAGLVEVLDERGQQVGEATL